MEILNDCEITNILEILESNPDEKSRFLKNPLIREKLEILVKAGLLKLQ